jgi:ABC-2 type transport system ATP-binding protein
LDEPTTGLDPEAQLDFRETLLRLSRERGTTVFLNSHNLDEVQKVCTHIAILDQGIIRLWDSMGKVRERFREPTVEITVQTDEDAQRTASILKKDQRVGTIRRNGRRFVCEVSGNGFPLKELVTADIEIDEFRKSTKTLEEVYMEIMRKNEGREE